MPEQPEFNETFKHFRSGDGLTYLVVTVVLMLVFAFVAYESLPAMLCTGTIGFSTAFISFLIFGAKVTLTEDAVIKYGLGEKERKIFYEDIYRVRMHSLTLISKQETIQLGRSYDDYERLYALLRQRISPSAFNDRMDLPWKLRMRTIGFGNGEREILLTDERIIVNQNNHENIWSISQIQRIYLEGGPKYRGFSNEFDAIIKIKRGPRIIINERQIRGFQFTSEHFVANLHRLYPHTAPSVPNAPFHPEWLAKQGHQHLETGNISGAIKLYEQALSTDRYPGLFSSRKYCN